MQDRRWGTLLLMFLLPILLLACGDSSPATNVKSGKISEAERLLMDYIRREQLGDFGVNTNRIESDQNEDAASGHEVLSESAGIMLRYYVTRPNQHLFDKTLEQAKDLFEQEGGFSYRYSPKQDKRFDANAAVDDLRIIRALYEGAEVFRHSAYRSEAKRYGERLLEHNVQNGNLYDFYDMRLKQRNGFLTLCYADLRTLQYIADHNREADKLAERMLAVVEGGYLSEQFPFYETRYNYESGRYESDRIHMVESMLTVLSLAEIGKERQESMDAIKRMVASGELYGQYDKAGTPLSDIRSTALYAIAALIGREVDDKALYEDAIAHMVEFQIMDVHSVLYGGFGDPVTRQAYSFDNLMALLALAS
ncbi:hypothetical protein ACX1C1_00320 [Paenibacillus sp. strain BS8-2]